LHEFSRIECENSWQFVQFVTKDRRRLNGYEACRIWVMPPTPQLECYILDTGHCLAHEHILIRGGERREVACHSIVALLGHPERGWLLWDTGYAPRMIEVTAAFPYRLYRYATPLRLRPELAVASQLPRWRLAPADIGQIIVSHFHADHLAGLHDFPASRFVALPEAYASVARRKGIAAVRRAFIPALLPADFQRRLALLDRFDGPTLPLLGPSHDLFGDGSVLLVRLPGHAAGQLGALVNTTRGPILFVADSCWMARSVRENRPPSSLVNFLADDVAAMHGTIACLHAFAALRPDVLIVPSHCPETFAREVGG
jgi:glyoxylase-like metal-dependent hydrolase (beta-lactamase superfamily II)